MLRRLQTWCVWCLKEYTGSCAEVTRLLSQGMDRPLSWHARFRIRVHYLICEFCRRYGRQLKFLREAMRRYPERLTRRQADEATRPHRLSAEARERLKQRLRSETGP